MTTPAPVPTRKRRRTSLNEDTKLLHVNLPAHIVESVRQLAAEERRTITAQVTMLLEDSPDLLDFQKSNAATSQSWSGPHRQAPSASAAS